MSDNLNSKMQQELAELLVDTLNLEINPSDIDANESLFGDSTLGLDSIDALEIALVISKKYGFEFKSEDAERFNIFSNLKALAAYVDEHKAG